MWKKFSCLESFVDWHWNCLNISLLGLSSAVHVVEQFAVYMSIDSITLVAHGCIGFFLVDFGSGIGWQSFELSRQTSRTCFNLHVSWRTRRNVLSIEINSILDNHYYVVFCCSVAKRKLYSHLVRGDGIGKQSSFFFLARKRNNNGFLRLCEGF